MRKQMTIKPKHNIGDFLRIKQELPLPKPKIKMKKDTNEPMNPEMDWLKQSGNLYRVSEVLAQICYSTTQIFYLCKKYKVLAATDEDFLADSRKTISSYELVLMDDGKIIKLREDEVIWINPKKFNETGYWGE